MTIRGKKSLRNAFFRALGPNAATFKAMFDAARQLLETSSMLVANIATACGFYDQSHFTRAFIQERGIAPGTYRRQHTARAANRRTSA